MSPRMDGGDDGTETITIKVNREVADELSNLSDDRVQEIVEQALVEALDVSESAQERRDNLREKIGLASHDSEELSDVSDLSDDLSDRQKRLIDAIRKGGRR